VKILVSWLHDFVDVPVAPSKLASDLHMAGFEVASVEPPPGGAGIEADAVIDFEITANRPDCLSVAGMAREVATLYDVPLRRAALAPLGTPDPAAANGLRVTLEDAGRCPRYCGAVADVRVGPSPEWMQQRLAAAGIRAINNLVDITNYVLLELGHPMHAFDLERLGGRELRVRVPHEGERITTLDGQDRALAPDMLVIADEARAVAIGGVMGGASSEVSSSTRVVALESAWFEPTGIRRTGKRLGLSTEASYRFERGADIDAPPVALARACALIEQTTAGTVRPGWIDAYPVPRAPRTVSLAPARVAQVLGVEIDARETERILTGLGFGVTGSGGVLSVTVPPWRIDVARDVDLVEELARHHGYDRLPTNFPELAHVPARPDRRLERDRLVRRIVAGAGFAECVTFSFIARDAAAPFADPADAVEILNPLSEQFTVLRPSLLPGLVDAVAHNRRRGQDDVRVFELGTIFGAAGGERRSIALAWLGAGTPDHWGQPRRTAEFFDLKGIVEAVASALGVALHYAPVVVPHLVPGRSAGLMAAGRDGATAPVGTLGLLAPVLAAARDLPAGTEIYVAELDLDVVLPHASFDATVSSVPPPRHPSVVRDVSIVVDDTLPAADVRGTIRASAPQTLVRIREFDRYQGKGVPDGRVSLSYRLTFQAPERTLTDGEVQRAMDEILQALVRTHGAVQR
jgi:phenylalanyl-tRNA synthetase beta chain